MRIARCPAVLAVVDALAEPTIRKRRRWIRRFAHHWRILREYYSGERHASDSGIYKDDIAQFFLKCAHFRDQLIHDSAVAVPDATILGFFWNSDPLSLSGDFADTWKHHTRTPRSGRLPRSVRIGSVSSTFRATVVWREPTTNVQHSRDVLVLVEQAVDEWRRFLQLHQL